MSEHWDAVEADFQRFYRLDLAGACWGPGALGAARLLALVRELPAESALMRALGQWWTPDMELAAQMIELLWQQFRQLVALGGARAADIPRPFHYPRPKAIASQAAAQRVQGPADGDGARTLSDYRRMFGGTG